MDVSRIDPHINLLPLTDPQKEIFTAAVRLVRPNHAEFADAVRWLEREYSVDAYRKRFEQQWEQTRRWDERQALSAPSIAELRAWRDGGSFSTTSSWRSKNDENGNTICGKSGEPLYFFDQEQDDKRLAEAKEFDPQTYALVMHLRRDKLKEIETERREGRAVSQVERLQLAIQELADQRMEIGGNAKAHARKLVLVAYFAAWHETCDDLGEFGRWQWDGLDVPFTLESTEEAKLRRERPLGRDRVLFHCLPGHEREMTVRVESFVERLEKAIPLLADEELYGRTLEEVSQHMQSQAERLYKKETSQPQRLEEIHLEHVDDIRAILRRALALGAFANRPDLCKIAKDPSSTPVFFGRLTEVFSGKVTSATAKPVADTVQIMAEEILGACGRAPTPADGRGRMPKEQAAALAPKRAWGATEWLAAISIVVAVVAIVVSLIIPECRRWIGLDNPDTPPVPASRAATAP